MNYILILTGSYQTVLEGKDIAERFLGHGDITKRPFPSLYKLWSSYHFITPPHIDHFTFKS